MNLRKLLLNIILRPNKTWLFIAPVVYDYKNFTIDIYVSNIFKILANHKRFLDLSNMSFVYEILTHLLSKTKRSYISNRNGHFFVDVGFLSLTG